MPGYDGCIELSAEEMAENREHRIAYMIDKDVSREDAIKYCNARPWEYGEGEK